MKHRLFIAINLPEDVKKELQKYQYQWPELPVRWVKGDNLHLTLVFIGYATDEGFLEVCQTVKEVAQRHQPFSINLTKICYGPPPAARSAAGGGKPPRMVWAMAEAIEDFASLKADLETALTGSSQIRFIPEKRDAKVHITLGRIRQWDFRRIDPEERPEVDEEINLAFQVETIEVMESKLKKTGAEYAVFESYPLVGEEN